MTFEEIKAKLLQETTILVKCAKDLKKHHVSARTKWLITRTYNRVIRHSILGEVYWRDNIYFILDTLNDLSQMIENNDLDTITDEIFNHEDFVEIYDGLNKQFACEGMDFLILRDEKAREKLNNVDFIVYCTDFKKNQMIDNLNDYNHILVEPNNKIAFVFHTSNAKIENMLVAMIIKYYGIESDIKILNTTNRTQKEEKK